jgi:Gpi18-like mannosyltransferase
LIEAALSLQSAPMRAAMSDARLWKARVTVRRKRTVVDAATSRRPLDVGALFDRIRSSLPQKARVGAVVTGLGGLSAGMFFWYTLVTRTGGADASSDLLLLVCVAGGIACALGLWVWFSRYMARTFGVDEGAMLQSDSYSFLPLFASWIYIFQVPPALSSAPSLALCIALLMIAVKLALIARHSAMMRAACVVFIATRVPLMIIAPLAAIVIGQRQGQHFSPGRGVLLDVWGRWDAQHYLAIAAQGYHGKDIAFFPLYPFVMHLLGGFIGDHLVAGLIISNAAFFIALLYLYALVKLEFGEDTVAFRSIFYIAIFPTAIFFSAVYTESLFLMLTVASVYYARRGNFITSGIFGALASMARVEGVLTALPLVYEVWRAWRERRGTTLVRGVVGTALVPTGLFAYMFYLYALQGNPVAFSQVQSQWNRHFSAPWTSINNTVLAIFTPPFSSTSITHVIELTFTLAFIALMVVAFRSLRMSYALYFAASLLVPMCTSSLMSMPRFVLVVFPAFMLLALWGRRPAVNAAIVSSFLPVLGLFTVLYADWYWLA